MAVVGNIMVRVGADISELQRQMTAAQRAMRTAGEQMMSIGSSITTFVTAPILAAAGASVKLASDMAETTNKVDVAFKDNAEEVKKWSKTSITSMGLASQTALDSAALYGDMATSMGLGTSQASKMSTGLVQLGADMASFKNVPIEQAMTALNGVFSGETESLKMLGIVMTETNLQEFALSEGINKKVQAMTQAEKVQLRYNFILDKTKNAQGDFARTSDGAANQMRMVGESIKQLGVQFGTILLPAVTKILNGLNEMLVKFQNLSPETQNMIVTIGLLVAAIGPLVFIIGTLQKAFALVQVAMAAIPIIISTISGGIAIFTGAAATGTAGATALAGALTLMTGPVGIVIAAVAALTAAVIYLWTTNEDFRKAVTDVWNKISAVASQVFGGIKAVIETIFNGLKAFWDQWGGTITSIFNSVLAIWGQLFEIQFNIIKAIFENVFNTIKIVVETIFNSLKSFWDKWGSDIMIAFNTLWGAFKAVFGAAMSAVDHLLKATLAVLKGDWSTAWSEMGKVFGAIWDGITATLKGAINIIIDGINFLIRQLNKIKIAIPDWVPEVGGKSFGFSVREIPHLARGGIVNGAQTFVAGEAGAEAIVPLENSDFISKFASMVASQSNNNNSSSQEIVISIDGVKLARAMIPVMRNESSRIGNTAIISVN